MHTEAGTPVHCAPYPRPVPMHSWSMRDPPCIASCPQGCQNLRWWARLEHSQESGWVSRQSALLCLPRGMGTSYGGAEAVPGAQMASCGLRPTRTMVVWPGDAAMWRGGGMMHTVIDTEMRRKCAQRVEHVGVVLQWTVENTLQVRTDHACPRRDGSEAMKVD